MFYIGVILCPIIQQINYTEQTKLPIERSQCKVLEPEWTPYESYIQFKRQNPEGLG